MGGLGRRSAASSLRSRSRTSWVDALESFVVVAVGDILAGTGGDLREPVEDVGLGCCLIGGWLYP
jgi:hypothetical protein